MHHYTSSHQHQQFIPGPKPYGESTASTPFKFDLHPQKNTTNQESIPLKRSAADANSNTTVTEIMTRRMFDPGFPQSFSSHRVEPHIVGGSPYSPAAGEDLDIKPPFASRTSSRLTSEPVDVGFSSRQFLSSTRESSKGSVNANAQKPDPNLIEPNTALNPSSVYFLKFQEEWANERDELRLQLAAKIEENTTLSKDMVQLENGHQKLIDKHRDSIGRAAKSYAALKSELDTLKISADLAISEAKAAKDGFTALRDSAQTSLRDYESMFDDDGEFVLTARTKEIVHELRSELSKTQQVADLLRDKLHTMGTELAEARSRNAELEGLAVADRERSESITVKVSQTASQILEVTQYLQEQKHESLQAKAKATEMEQQLVYAQTSLREAQSVIASMKEEMTALEELHEEQGAKLRTLHHTIDFQEGNLRAIEARAQKAEEELLRALNHNHELQGRLEPAKELAKNLTQQASRLLSEHDEAKAKVQSLERQLSEVQTREKVLSFDMAKTLNERDALVHKLKSFDDVRREVDMYREKYTECQVSLKALRERFDDQCVTLAASKESIGELQETLAELKREMANVQGQSEVLQTRLHRADKEIEDKRDSLQALQHELSHKEGAFQALLETERSGKNEALHQLQNTKTKVQSLLAEVGQKDRHVKEMAEQLATAESPSDEQEVAVLKLRIAELEAAEKRLAERAATITSRYKDNDLNDDEKAFVTQLLQKARSIHEREMVEKTNALKLRDNVIKQCEERIEQLEKSLSRRLQEESSAKSTNEQSNSMTVDATKPRRPSPDHHPEIRGAGHEAPSTIVTHGAAEGTTVNLSLPGPSSRSVGSATFAKLCGEETDDIADFEGEKLPVATGKRVLFAEVESESESLRPARRVKHGRASASGLEKMTVDQAALPDSSTGSGSGTGNRKKAAPRRR